MDEYEMLQAEVARLAPRVFAVCEVERDDEGEITEGTVSAWGMEFTDDVHWVSPGGYQRGISDDVNKVVRLLGRGCEAHLVWT